MGRYFARIKATANEEVYVDFNCIASIRFSNHRLDVTDDNTFLIEITYTHTNTITTVEVDREFAKDVSEKWYEYISQI